MNQKILDEILKQSPVSLMEILDAKETRVQHQQDMMLDKGTLISFTLNIPGAIKSCPLFSLAFARGKAEILRQIAYQGGQILNQAENHLKTGDELYLLTDLDIRTVKCRMVEIEENFSFGRLFDIDVMNSEVPKISRTELSLPPRRCLVCGCQAAACARSQRHSPVELLEAIISMICDTIAQENKSLIARSACRALLYEVNTAPKPGLVDREDNGAHKDMDSFSFIDSACALIPYFERCAEEGAKGQDWQSIFETLRYLGKEAEERMKAATGGVNTHKGAIFSMGIFCAMAGAKKQKEFLQQIIPEKPTEPFCWETAAKQMCAHLLRDFDEVEKKIAEGKLLTHGEKLYRDYKITGIRGEAAQGFPAVFQVGLPFLRQEIRNGKSLNDAGVLTLLHLMKEVQDTNILIRSDLETLQWAQSRVSEILQHNPDKDAVHQLNREFIEKNISPGGCADLLALCYFVLFIEKG